MYIYIDVYLYTIHTLSHTHTHTHTRVLKMDEAKYVTDIYISPKHLMYACICIGAEHGRGQVRHGYIYKPQTLNVCMYMYRC